MLSKQIDLHIKKIIGETASSQIELPRVRKGICREIFIGGRQH